jgi:hypothetical protein
VRWVAGIRASVHVKLLGAFMLVALLLIAMGAMSLQTINGVIGENDVIDAKTLPRVKMPNRDGFVPDARPDVGKAAKTRKR